MKLSRTSTYALYGLAYLADQPHERWVPLSEIAQRCPVPVKHLGLIFRSLVRGKLLHSSRGVKGGFRLARPAGRISPLDVIEAIEGPIEQSGCLLSPRECGDEARCRVNGVWRRAQRQMLAVLRAATLADMTVIPQRRKATGQPRP